MTTFATVLLVVVALVAVFSLGTAIAFWVYCLKVEKAWMCEPRMENEPFWKLESQRKKFALASIIAYAVSVGLTTGLKSWFEISQTYNLTFLAIASAGILIVGLRAMVHNDRSFEQWLKRRYQSF